MKNSFFFILICFVFSCENDSLTNESNCESTILVVNDQQYDSIESDYHTITEVMLNENCLEIKFSGSGCDASSWEVDLYSPETVFLSYPYTRLARIKLFTNQACQAVFQKNSIF